MTGQYYKKWKKEKKEKKKVKASEQCKLKRQKKKKKKRQKPLLVFTFLGDSHFSPYILFLPLLVSILKNASRFGPCRYIRNREDWRDKWQE